jgi:hypothetical protein
VNAAYELPVFEIKKPAVADGLSVGKLKAFGIRFTKLKRGALRRLLHQPILTPFIGKRNANFCVQKRLECGRTC